MPRQSYTHRSSRLRSASRSWRTNTPNAYGQSTHASSENVRQRRQYKRSSFSSHVSGNPVAFHEDKENAAPYSQLSRAKPNVDVSLKTKRRYSNGSVYATDTPEHACTSTSEAQKQLHSAKARAYARKDGQPGAKGYRLNLFPNMSARERNGLQIDEVGRYCVTDSKSADKTARIIEILLGKPARECTVTDACASIGGNTFGFARRFGHCNAVEMNDDRHEKLKANLDVLNLSDHVCVLHGSYLHARDYTRQDCTFFDPPWGGVAYHKERLISLNLGGVDVAQLCNESKSALCVVKVPFNFDRESFLQQVESQSVCEVKVRNYALICVQYHSNSGTEPGDILRSHQDIRSDRVRVLSCKPESQAQTAVKNQTRQRTSEEQAPALFPKPQNTSPMSSENNSRDASEHISATKPVAANKYPHPTQKRVSRAFGKEIQPSDQALHNGRVVSTERETTKVSRLTETRQVRAPTQFQNITPENDSPSANSTTPRVFPHIADHPTVGEYIVISPAERKREAKRRKSLSKKEKRRSTSSSQKVAGSNDHEKDQSVCTPQSCESKGSSLARFQTLNRLIASREQSLTLEFSALSLDTPSRSYSSSTSKPPRSPGLPTVDNHTSSTCLIANRDLLEKQSPTRETSLASINCWRDVDISTYDEPKPVETIRNFSSSSSHVFFPSKPSSRKSDENFFVHQFLARDACNEHKQSITTAAPHRRKPVVDPPTPTLASASYVRSTSSRFSQPSSVCKSRFG